MPNLRHLPRPPLPDLDEEAGRDLYLRLRGEALADIRHGGALRGLRLVGTAAAALGIFAAAAVREDGFIMQIHRVTAGAIAA